MRSVKSSQGMKLESTVYNNKSHTSVDQLHIKHYKKELKRIDWDIVKRLIMLLYYESKMKRTNIAMKCKLSYGNCLLYLNWLEIMDLIKKETDTEGFELISLAEKGKDLYTRQLQRYEAPTN